MSRTNRQIQKEQTKKMLLKTAFWVFSENGILNTRMSDIAETAGVSHGTVFLHFKTQEALITDVIETFGRKIAFRTHELANSCEHIKDILEAHLSTVAEYEPFYTQLVVENRFLPIAARDMWVSIQSAISFHFSQALKRDMQEGRCISLPADFLFNTWIGLLHHYLANGDLFAPEGNVLKRHGKMLVASYMKMISDERDGING